LIAPFVTAEVSDDGFTFDLPLPLQDGSFAVTNLPGGGAASPTDTRSGCVQPSLGGAWNEFEATTAVLTGAILTVEGLKVTPAITHGVGEGDCATMTTMEPSSGTASGLQILLPSEVLGEALTAPVTITDSGWTWTFSP
jgi:hypothetical protein